MTYPCINVTACESHGTCVNVNFNTRNINIIHFILILDSATDSCGSHSTCVNINFNTRNIIILKF